jgi:hypothetical protein
MKGALFHTIPFFNCPKFYGRHIESCNTGMTRNGLVLMSCLTVMFKVIQPFLEDEQKLSVGEFVDAN